MLEFLKVILIGIVEGITEWLPISSTGHLILVESLMPYGAFVNLGNGISGLVHISQISQRRIKKPSEVLKEGQKVKVKILNTNDNKVSLSMKALEEVMEDVEENREPQEYTSGESVSTSLGDLLSKLNL